MLDYIFRDLKRCVNCLLPETFPGIRYDNAGVCNYCNEYEPINVYGEDKLIKLLDAQKNKGEKYDCLVPISGGRDSSYVLHQIIKQFDMNPLAVTVDTDYLTKEAHYNLEHVTENLGVDLLIIKDKEINQKLFTTLKLRFNAFLKKPSINMIVPTLNSGDSELNIELSKCAKKYNIKIILGGNNVGNSSMEQEHFKTGFLGVFPNSRGYYSTWDKFRLFYKFFIEYATNTHNYNYSVFREYTSGILAYFFESIFRPSGIGMVGFYDYVYWNEEEVLSTIEKIGWKKSDRTTATWRIGDAAYPLIDYLYYNIVGFTEFDEFYSKMIREKQLSRSDALIRCRSDNKSQYGFLDEFLSQFNVTLDEVDDVILKYRNKFLSSYFKDNKNIQAMIS